MKKAHVPSPRSNAPLSGAYEANGIVFVSGQVHADAEWKLHGETIEEKLDIALGNIKRILGEADLSLENVIHVRLYVTDIKELPALNTAYKTYFKDPLPARTAVCVAALPLGASVEVEVIAARGT
ncbi:MAG: RidA family protein [Patescibacteria group bacterium]